MKYWWHVKRYGDSPIRVKPEVGEKIRDIWARAKQNNKEEIVTLPGNVTLSTSAISAVEQTTDRVEDDNIYKLTGGQELKPYGKGKPLYAPDYEYGGRTYLGGVIANWYKKNIDRREWDDFYAKRTGYYRLDDPDKSIWVAVLLIEEEGALKPPHYVACTAEEARYLDEIRSGT